MNFIYLRYGLIALFLILGVVLHLQLGISQAWYLYAAAALLILSHLFLGNVWQAFSMLKRGKPAKAEKMLGHTWAPGLLLKSNRAYYYFTQGMLHLQREELDTARPLLEQATQLQLRYANDNALAHLNLAHIHFVQKNKTEAAQHLATAKSFEPTDLMIKDNLEKMQQALSR
jgi:tetratricopeptide (TPR) repeat protein